MRSRAADLSSVSALAVTVTVLMAAPILRAPSERMFGMEIVGRHHDPFTVMEQFGRPLAAGVYVQPVTDFAGALLARLWGTVAAYNWVVLLSFPLSAAAAHLLARHLALSRTGATVAAMAYAFSPFHVAQAAYHPHIAQTQWVPLYLLALWRCLDNASPVAMVALGAAAVAVTLSNFYGGLIAAVLTPVAVTAYWVVRRGIEPQRMPLGRLAATLATLVCIAAAGIAYASYAAGDVLSDRTDFAFPRADLFRFSAKWWSYLIPPVAHPLVGEAVLRFWGSAGVTVGLLEQQVSLGWGVVALGLIASFRWMVPGRGVEPPASSVYVPVLAVVAIAALVCSLSPERTIGTFTFVRPSAILYGVVPMFRSYARFGVVVQLMAALLAGVAIDWLRRAATPATRAAAVLLATLAAAEYMVWPPSMWRDVLPTSAHRWVMRQPGPLQALDCAPLTNESVWVRSQTSSRIRPMMGEVDDCLEPDLARKLAATGYTHLMVRRDTEERRWFANRPAPEGLQRQARLRDGDVFSVSAAAPAVYTVAMTSFFAREHDRAWTWRWMGSRAVWRIANTTSRAVAATLHLEVLAFNKARRLELQLDGHPLDSFIVEPTRRMYAIGPIALAPGDHQLAFRAVEPAALAADAIAGDDRRSLMFAVGTWTWTVKAERP